VNAYVRPLLRFWWVLALGLCVAALAGVLVTDSVKLGVPPKLKTRATPEYQADAQLVVDTASGALFNTGSLRKTPQPDKTVYQCTRDAKGVQHCKYQQVPVPPVVEQVAPNYNLLTQRANLYPSLIEGTPFLNYRDKLFPHLPKHATMTATALGATRSGGRIHASPVPIDVITVTAKTPKAALTVANATLQAFGQWIDAQQDAVNTPKSDRVVIRPIVAPTKAINTTASTTTLAGLIAVLVFALFVGLVYVLERAMPRKEKVAVVEDVPAESPEPLAHAGRRERERDERLAFDPELSRARTSDTPY
jgi:RES domain-containing protein